MFDLSLNCCDMNVYNWLHYSDKWTNSSEKVRRMKWATTRRSGDVSPSCFLFTQITLSHRRSILLSEAKWIVDLQGSCIIFRYFKVHCIVSICHRKSLGINQNIAFELWSVLCVQLLRFCIISLKRKTGKYRAHEAERYLGGFYFKDNVLWRNDGWEIATKWLITINKTVCSW